MRKIIIYSRQLKEDEFEVRTERFFLDKENDVRERVEAKEEGAIKIHSGCLYGLEDCS